MSIILLGQANKTNEEGIALQTSKQSNVINSQTYLEDSHYIRCTADSYKERYPEAIFKNNPSGMYNCHGMTFANRRTGIYDVEELHKILSEDMYSEVSAINEVLPGDIILYFSEDGDIEHSGMIVKEPDKALKIPIVLSKWGMLFEVIHSAYICPYDTSRVKFYRCRL